MRRNRRAFTRGVVRDNSILTIVRMRDGFAHGSAGWHYRRHISHEVYTGVVRPQSEFAVAV